MKKTISILLCTILAVSFLAACGSASYDNVAYPAEAPMMMEAAAWDTMEMDYGEATASAMHISGGSADHVSAPVSESFSEKIIYSIYADIETLNFDESIENVYKMLDWYGAFIEYSSISGTNYESRFYGWNEYRHASFTIRVPKENLDPMRESLDLFIGNVVHQNSSAENITSQFYDVQSRLNSLEIQEERLLSMLSQSNDITDLIALEERLGEIRYQIEALTTTLRNWQSQVDYSTMTISIREVEQYTEPTQIHRSYWQQIGDGFMSSLRGVGRFFMGLFRWLIVSAPVLVVLAVVAVIVLIIVRKVIRSNAEKMKKIRERMPKYPAAPGYTYPPGYTHTPGYPVPPAQPNVPGQPGAHVQPDNPEQPAGEPDKPEQTNQ